MDEMEGYPEYLEIIEREVLDRHIAQEAAAQTETE